MSASDFHSPNEATLEEVCRVHNPDYVHRLKTEALTPKEVRAIGFPLTAQLINREFIIAGGTLWGCHQALEKGIAFNIAGGRIMLSERMAKHFACLTTRQLEPNIYWIKAWLIKY